MYDASIDFSGRALKDRPLISYPNFVENARVFYIFLKTRRLAQTWRVCYIGNKNILDLHIP